NFFAVVGRMPKKITENYQKQPKNQNLPEKIRWNLTNPTGFCIINEIAQVYKRGDVFYEVARGSHPAGRSGSPGAGAQSRLLFEPPAGRSAARCDRGGVWPHF